MKNYIRRMLFILPITFLYTPLFTLPFKVFSLAKYLSVIEYFYLFAFFYLGATLGYTAARLSDRIGKNKSLLLLVNIAPYIVMAILAIAGRNLVTMLYKSAEEPISASELLYPIIAAVLSGVAAALGIIFSNMTAYNYIRRYTVVYYVWAFINVIFSPLFFGLFYVSFFYVRNIISINMTFDIHRNDTSHTTSIIMKRRSSYIWSVAAIGVIPLLAGVFILPYLLDGLKAIGKYVGTFIIIAFVGQYKENEPSVPHDSPSDPGGEMGSLPSIGDAASKLILAVVVVLLIFLVIKYRESILMFFKFMRREKENEDDFVLCRETIVSVNRNEKDHSDRASYAKFLKKFNSIADHAERFKFAYGYIFWNIVEREEKIRENFTPREMVDVVRADGYIYKYARLDELTDLYETLEYGGAAADNLADMLDTAREFARKYE